VAICPCDDRPFPPVLDIPAGLGRLPRQIAGFPEFRLALLAGISGQPALDAWRAREGDDFGVMMLEWWAYVLDVLAFYGSEIANELYLRTAVRDASLRRLTGLIGYALKPPLAASATLALFAEPGQPITVPPGTAFRSDAFDGEPPQIFETSAAAMIAKSLNAWEIQPIRPATFDGGPLLLDPRTAGPAEGQLVLLTWGTSRKAARAKSVQPTRMLDGELYVRLELDPAPSIPSTQAVDGIAIGTLPLRAGLTPFLATPVTRGGAEAALVLDAIYPQLRVATTVVVENVATGEFHAAVVANVEPNPVDISGAGTGTMAPLTKVTLEGDGPPWLETAAAASLTLHFGAVSAGRVVRPADAEITLDDLLPSASLAGPIEPLQLATQSRVLLQDALELGTELAGNVSDDRAGAGTLTPLGDATPFAQALRTPVKVFGNLVAVTRGESVEEILGSGDGTQSFQRFRLTKKPLTYLSAPGTATGRQSTLEIWVGGVRWREIESLFLAGPEDEVYTVRQTVDGDGEVTFGGLGYGKPLPSGPSNVRARYRYGAGAASPPAGAIRQLSRPVKGIRRALNPLAAFGGDDGDAGADIRKAAPDSALSLGRAISLLDFEAIARGYRGILNAVAVMAWDEREQRAAVKIYFIPPSADAADQLRDDLQDHLRAIAAPGTPITVAVAQAEPHTLALDFEVAANRDDAEIETAALNALTDDEAFLALRNVPIGAPVFRGDILAAVRAVDGVVQVRGLLMDNATAPFAITVADGGYLLAAVVRQT
jgi:hypothetical protein